MTLEPIAEGAVASRRTVKSFVMRSGRMTEGQARALEQVWPLFGLEHAAGMQNLDQLFARSARRTLEIGFGMGQSLLSMAATAPEEDFIGIEVHRPGVGALLHGIAAQQLSNIRVYRVDALDVLRDCIAPESLDRVLLFFPDPWHKSRHHKRRIVQPEWAQMVRKVLKVGGILHIATDWQPYAEHILEVLNAAPGYRNVARAAGYIARPMERPFTRFEARAERLQHAVWDLQFEQVS